MRKIVSSLGFFHWEATLMYDRNQLRMRSSILTDLGFLLTLIRTNDMPQKSLYLKLDTLTKLHPTKSLPLPFDDVLLQQNNVDNSVPTFKKKAHTEP